jgi:DNA polymerase III epsilon subunit-like protein
MLAAADRFICLDFETTGVVRGYQEEPWQIGIAKLSNLQLTNADIWESWLNVGPRPFNRYAPGRYEEIRKQLAVAPKLVELWSELASWLRDYPIVAHNAGTERRVLKQAFPILKNLRWIDTLKLSRLALPNLTSYKMEDLIVTLDLKTTIDVILESSDRAPHDALYDAIASALVLAYILRQESWAKVTTEDLIAMSKNR